MSSSEESRQSLLNLFSPPDDKRRGVFGLVCGLSAEEQFMDSALERFTGLGRTSRKHTANLSLMLCRDIHIQPRWLVPGLYEPFPSAQLPETIKLMHAKVALLGFGLSAAGEPDYYRLIVSTGNWTKESVNNNINLAWFCDHHVTGTDDQRQNAADILEAVNFWQQLLGVANSKTGYYQLDEPARERIGHFLEVLTANIPSPKKTPPRFISNLLDGKAAQVDGDFQADSMGAHVIQRFSHTGTRRNLIVCGSGFFEQAAPGNKAGEPEVIKNLSGNLVKSKVLTKDAYHWLVINPKKCGAAGPWITNSDLDGLNWTICLPRHPDFKNTPYPFHAKYVFIGNNNDSSITSGLLYLGSGNLSKQGFALSPGAGGNIEAGVIFDTKRYDDIDELCICLGIDPDNDLDLTDIPEDTEGEDSEQENNEVQVPPPIASCLWSPKTQKLTWKWTDTNWDEVQLNGQLLVPDLFELNIPDPAIDLSGGVKLSAKKNGRIYEWFIPVFTANNAFCCPPVQPKTGRGIIDALAAFPHYSSEDDDDDEDDGGDDGGGIVPTIPGVQNADFSELRDELDRFPLHLATALIETIAEKNQQLTPGELPDWVALLRRTLIEEMNAETKSQLMTLGGNMLDPLLTEKGFAPAQPPVAEINMLHKISGSILIHPEEAYAKAIREIMEDWRIHAGTPIARKD